MNANACIITVDTMCQTVTTGELLIQHHIEPSPKPGFNRSWTDFKNGFCDSYGNFWIGNERLYQATKTQFRRIRVELTGTNNKASLFPEIL